MGKRRSIASDKYGKRTCNAHAVTLLIRHWGYHDELTLGVIQVILRQLLREKHEETNDTERNGEKDTAIE